MNIDKVENMVSPLEKELKELARYIHENPEIGLEEHKACRAQVELLRKYGFEVKTGVYGLETAYEAVYKGKTQGLKIAMLAEYDALPELGHGCGHNLIAMVGVGSGIAMRELADTYGGEIHVFGTPAEETQGAKVSMARQGAFDTMDVAMMAHPMNQCAESMNTMAIKAYRIKYYGKPAHAAAAPEEGINALDAAIGFFNMVNALRQQTKEDARLHGIIVNGGSSSNTIPDYSEIVYCIRSNKMSDLENLAERVIDCAKAAALATGCRLEYEKADEDFKDTNSNQALSRLHTEQMEGLGIPIERANGQVTPGSSDLGDVSYVCPAIQPVFDICEGKAINPHTREFTERAGLDSSMEMALTYVKGFLLTAEKLMSQPEYMEEIRAEFAQNILGR